MYPHLLYIRLILVILGARFGFVLEEELKEAAACDDVKNALKAKISKERIGTEVIFTPCHG
jgi:prolipoprotein diacylglyceryltransferase